MSATLGFIPNNIGLGYNVLIYANVISCLRRGIDSNQINELMGACSFGLLIESLRHTNQFKNIGHKYCFIPFAVHLGAEIAIKFSGTKDENYWIEKSQQLLDAA